MPPSTFYCQSERREGSSAARSYCTRRCRHGEAARDPLAVMLTVKHLLRGVFHFNLVFIDPVCYFCFADTGTQTQNKNTNGGGVEVWTLTVWSQDCPLSREGWMWAPKCSFPVSPQKPPEAACGSFPGLLSYTVFTWLTWPCSLLYLKHHGETLKSHLVPSL